MIKLFSQRDPRWANEKLGFSSTSTIGGYGCTLTCISMLAGITPSEANSRMKAVGGFQNDLILWSKIKEAIPWLEWEWRGYSYENDRVLQAIEDNGGCLVQVDFDGTPRTSDQHWVLFVGNKKMYDPWTGTEEPTSKYPLLTGYSIIKVKGDTPGELMPDVYKGLDLNNKESMKTTVDVWYEVMIDKLWVKKTELGELFNLLKADNVQTAVSEVNNRLDQISRLKEQLIREQELRIELSTELSDKGEVIKVYENNIVNLNSKIDQLAKEKGSLLNQIADLERQLEEKDEPMPEKVIEISCWEVFINNIKKLFRRES